MKKNGKKQNRRKQWGHSFTALIVAIAMIMNPMSAMVYASDVAEMESETSEVSDEQEMSNEFDKTSESEELSESDEMVQSDDAISDHDVNSVPEKETGNETENETENNTNKIIEINPMAGDVIAEGTLDASYISNNGTVTWTLDSEGTLTLTAHNNTDWIYYMIKEIGDIGLDEVQKASVKTLICDGSEVISNVSFSGYDYHVFPNIETLILKGSEVGYYQSRDDGNNSIKNIQVESSNGQLMIENFEVLEQINVVGEIKSIDAFSCDNLKTVHIKKWNYKEGYPLRFNDCVALESFVVDRTNVSEIKDGYSFENCKSLVKVYFPVPITYADFQGCSALTEFPDLSRITYVSGSAFEDCKGLTEIRLPALQYLGTYAFKGCTSLKKIVIDSVKKGGDSGLGGLCYGCSSLESFIIEKQYEGAEPLSFDCNYGVDYNFQGCPNLKTVEIYAKVLKIQDDDFSGCTNLEKVDGFYDLQSIGICTFLNCSSLVTIPELDKIESIGTNAFRGCSSLPYFECNSNSSIELGYSTFEGCTSLETVYIKNLKGLGQSVFSGCSSLKKMAAGSMEGPISLEDDAFSGCKKLVKLVFPEVVKSIGEGTFSGCSSLKELPDLEYLESINTSYTFSGCSSLQEFIFPENAVPSGSLSSMFKGCTSLKRVVLPENAGEETDLELGRCAFKDCKSLETVEGLDSVYELGQECFKGCENLAELELSDKVTFIYFDALPDGLEYFEVPKGISDIHSIFSNCSKLKEVVVHGGVSNMVGAFDKCDSLEKVVFQEGITAIPNELFANHTNLLSVKIPNTVTSIGGSAFLNCTKLSDITLPENLGTLKNSAFEGCSSLKSVKLSPSLSYIYASTFKNSGLSGGLLFEQSNMTVSTSAFENTDISSVYFKNTSLSIPDNSTSAFLGCNLKSVFFDCETVRLEGNSSTIFDMAPGKVSIYFMRGRVSLNDASFSQREEEGVDNQILVYIAPEVTSISGKINASNISGVTVIGEKGSYAETYAENNGYSFQATGEVSSEENSGNAYIEKDFQYTVSNGEATITKYIGKANDVTIPDSLGGCSVINISAGAFGNIMAAEVKNLTLSKAVKTVEPRALTGTLYTIENIYVVDDNPYLSAQDNVLYDKGKTKLLLVAKGVTEINIPSTVKTIGARAFSSYSPTVTTLPDGTESVYELVIPGNVTTLEENAFSGSGVRKITLENGLKKIGSWAFSGCDSLEYVDIPNSVTQIGDEAFARCKKLQYVTIGENVKTIGEKIFNSSTGTYYSVYDSDIWKYLKENYPENLGNGAVLGDYVVGIHISQPTTSVRDKILRTGAVMTGCRFEMTKLVLSEGGSAQIISTEEDRILATVPISLYEGNEEIYFGVTEEMLPADTEIYVNIDFGVVKEKGSVSESWTSKGYWTAKTFADCWPALSAKEKIDEELINYVLGKSRAKIVLDKNPDSGAGGLCFGMAVTAGLVKEGKPEVSAMGLDSMFEADLNTEIDGMEISVREFFELVFEMQSIEDFEDELERNKNDYNGFIKAVNNYFYHGGKPCIFGYRWENVGNTSHTLLPLAWTKGSVDDEGNFITDKPELIVYDCNAPQWEMRITFYLNEYGKVENWRYEDDEVSSFNPLRWMKYAEIPDYFYDIAKAYGNGEKNPYLEETQNRLMELKNEFNIPMNISASAGDKQSLVKEDDVSGDLLTPVTYFMSGETEGSSDDEVNSQLYWVKDDHPLHLSNVTAQASVSLAGDEGSITVQNSRKADMDISVINNMSESNSASIISKGPSSFKIILDYTSDEETESKYADSVVIEGTTSENTVEVTDQDNGFTMDGAESAVITISEDGKETSQKVDELDKYDSVEVIVEENSEDGTPEVKVKADTDGDGVMDKDVPVKEVDPTPDPNPQPGDCTETGHQNLEVRNKKNATCEEEGYTGDTYCKDCGELVKAGETIEAPGHSYGSWIVVSKATVFNKATRKHVCEVCGASETEAYGSKLKATVSVNASSLKLKTKQSTSKFKVTYAAGDSVKSWVSSNKKIFTVSGKSNGTCKIKAGSKTGKAKLTITLASGLVKTITITVQKKAVETTSVKNIPKKIVLKAGKTYKLSPTIIPITSTSKTTYKSSKSTVAKVSKSGVITAKKRGKAVITVQSGKKKVKCTVTVQ